ncbi:hypothetical protein [Pseudomonas oryzihabitans]|uniref:Uncharacterized protein n=1 Tax=Pseudomonas oryzihabitans TaxID=47885 RepID=A0A1G5MVL9_9PSED|nr:hypothetical protein [Pseudomonas psychrotolerans]NMY89786.1 hypothetical protein [Pseudomonas psychrotolerans]SCZ28619.1 hypothetical protein SAMN05216279_10383 [Pseudomonas psychrotolerans]
MIPDFVHDIRAREPQRASLGQAVEQYLAAGGSIAALPYLAPREPTRAAEFNSSVPRVRGIAAKSRSKKRAADEHAATFPDLLQTPERPHEEASQAEQHSRAG